MQPNQTIRYDEFKFYWEDELWLKYISRVDIDTVIASLLDGMDAASHEYVQIHMHLLKLLPYKKHILIDANFGWSRKDAEDATLAKHLASTLNMSTKDAFMHVNKYGMKDVPQDIFDKIDGKCIVDGGAYTGDTLILFNKLFPQSRIFAFEPQKSAFEQLKKTIQQHKILEKAVPVARGLSDKEEELALYTGEDVDSGATCNANAKYDKVPTDTIKTTTIDEIFKAMNAEVGLIKLDIEGLEMKALHGSEQTIKQYKPVIVAAIYHRPEDFFELKEHIKSLNPDYKFMIRRSEMVLPTADLVLVAY